MTEKTYSNCPVVKREKAQLVQRSHINHVRKTVFMPFEQEIVWLRETESKITYWHGGKFFHEGSTFSDYYGFFSSMKSAIEEAEKMLEHFNITTQSSLEVHVRTTISDYPMLETEADFGQKKAYYPVQEDNFWYYHQAEKMQAYLQQVNDSSEGYLERAMQAYELIENLHLQSQCLVDKAVVWSSKENMQEARETLIKIYTP